MGKSWKSLDVFEHRKKTIHIAEQEPLPLDIATIIDFGNKEPRVMAKLTELLPRGLPGDQVCKVMEAFLIETNLLPPNENTVGWKDPALHDAAPDSVAAAASDKFTRPVRSLKFRQELAARKSAKLELMYQAFQDGRFFQLHNTPSKLSKGSSSNLSASSVSGSKKTEPGQSTGSDDQSPMESPHSSPAHGAAVVPVDRSADEDPLVPAGVVEKPCLGKRYSATIFEKMTVIKHYETTTSKTPASDCKHMYPNLVKSPGQVRRWVASALTQHWRFLPVDVQRRFRELPYMVRKNLGLPSKGKMAKLPGPILEALDKVFHKEIAECKENGSSKPKRALKMRRVVETMKVQAHRYNDKVRAANEIVGEFIASQRAKYQAGHITAEVYKDAYKGLQRPMDTQPKSLYGRALNFVNDFGWKERKNNVPPGYLDLDDPKMVKWRYDYQNIRAMKKIHRKLILNYDQIWRCRYRPKRRELYNKTS